MQKLLRVGTRRSALAKTQTQWVISELSKRGIACDTVEITSDGDRDRSQPLYEIQTSSPGLFTKQLEQALLNGEIDLAVHSLKDLPTLQPKELKVWAVPTREVCSDVLICRREFYDPQAPWGVKTGARVGTSSLRREALLLSKANVQVHSVRGNVPTRVQLVVDGQMDAVVLASAGIKRLALAMPDNLVAQPLDETLFVSAPGQGALGIEGRTDLKPVWAEAVAALQDSVSALEVRWERHVLRELEGGCTLPLGVRCRRGNGGTWELFVFLGVQNPNQKSSWREFHHRGYTGKDPKSLAEEAIEFFQKFVSNRKI